jgi:hypothetical protein
MVVRWGRILDTVPQKGSTTGIRDGVQGYQRVQRVRPYMFRSLSRNSLTGPDVRRHPDGQRPSVSARPAPNWIGEQVQPDSDALVLQN